MRSSSAGLSVAIHLSAVLLMALLGARVASRQAPAKVRITIPLVYTPPLPQSTTGGGGQDDLLPPSRGSLPPRAASNIFVPPMITTSQPKLPVSAGLIDAPDLPIAAESYGDPLARAGIPSGGPGHRGGFGSGPDGGIGSRRGPSVASAGILQTRYTTPPRLVYKIEPEYPDEARKAKYQGVVVLRVDIDSHGAPTAVEIVRALGLGMDDRAAAAVSRWRFTPALENGKPVPASILVEVAFRLL